MSEFLETLVNSFGGSVFLEKVIIELSKFEFGESSKTSKAFAKFITKLSEGLPGNILKHMVLLQTHIDAEV